MIYEVARIKIKQDHEELFEAAVAKAVPIFRRASGCISMRLEKSIEEPQHYRIIVQWSRLEDHTVGFRESQDYNLWRDMVGDHFDGAPVVEHTAVILNGF